MFKLPSIGYERQIFFCTSLKGLALPSRSRSGITEYAYACLLAKAGFLPRSESNLLALTRLAAGQAQS